MNTNMAFQYVESSFLILSNDYFDFDITSLSAEVRVSSKCQLSAIYFNQTMACSPQSIQKVQNSFGRFYLPFLFSVDFFLPQETDLFSTAW